MKPEDCNNCEHAKDCNFWDRFLPPGEDRICIKDSNERKEI